MLRRNLRRLRFALFTLAAIIVIALALMVGLGQLAMPWLARNPQRVEAWLSARLHQPVHVGHLAAVWASGGPVLTLDDVRIGDPGKQPLQLSRAELALDFYAPLRGDRAWSEFRLVGVDVRLVHDEDGWHVRGFDLDKATDASKTAKAATRSDEMSMGALGAIVFKDLKLSIEDERKDIHVALAASELRAVNRGDITHIAGKVRSLASPETPIDLIADVDVTRRAGTFYAGGKDVDVAGIVGRRAFGGVQLLNGRGNAQVWATVASSRVNDLRLRIDLADVSLASAETIAADSALAVSPRAHFDRFAFSARWLRTADGWSADFADLAMTHGETTAAPGRIGIERHAGDQGTRFRAALADVPLEPLGSLAMLTTQAPDGLRRWLYLAHPSGQLSSADIDWRGAQDFDANAVLRDVGLADAGFVPGIEHIDAEIHGDAQALLLRVPEQALRVDYPRVFRKPFVFAQFGGDIVAYRDDDAWRLDTDRVVFEGEGYGGELRGGVEIQNDGTRPLLDLAAVVTHADVVAAKLFWPTITMPPAAVAYLDHALVSGKLDNGRVVVHGDLDSWPFHDESGRFEARGHITDMIFDYAPEWPRAEELDAIATFVGDSMQLEVDSLETGALRLTSASANIANLGEPVLELSAKGNGTGANLLAFLRASPVGKQYQ
ncbi:MAG: YhdP family protein, partial [Rhodanobacteraceae bacterium]